MQLTMRSGLPERDGSEGECGYRVWGSAVSSPDYTMDDLKSMVAKAVRAEGRSEKRRCNMQYVILRFCRYFGEEVREMLLAEPADVEDFLARSYGKPQTREYSRALLCAFFEWTRTVGLSRDNPAAAVKPIPYEQTRQEYTAADVEEFARFLAHAKAMPKSKAGLKKYAALLLHVHCCMTYQEIADAKVSDLYCGANGWTFHVRGHKSAEVHVSRETKSAIDEYLSSRGRYEGNSPLLPGRQRNEPPTAGTVGGWIRRMMREAGYESLNGLRVRRLAMLLAMRGGADVKDVMRANRYKCLKGPVLPIGGQEVLDEAGIQLAKAVETQRHSDRWLLFAAELREVAGRIGDDECALVALDGEGHARLVVRPLRAERSAFASLNDVANGVFGADLGAALRRFLQEFEAAPDKRALIAREPEWSLEGAGPEWRCYFAAAAQSLAREWGLPVPEWCMEPEYFLQEKVYPPGSSSHAVRRFLDNSTPWEFAQRGLMVGPHAMRKDPPIVQDSDRWSGDV